MSDTPDIVGTINRVDALFPELSITGRSEYIASFQLYIYGHFCKNQDPETNLIYLQRNCGKQANPYTQHFILNTFGEIIQPEKFIFVIPAVPPNPKKNVAGHAVISKPITFFTNIFAPIMVEFLTKRPELISLIDPLTNETILHQWALDYTVLKLAYEHNKALMTVRDKLARIPLHHKKYPHSLVSRALKDYPELLDAVNANGQTSGAVLGLSK